MNEISFRQGLSSSDLHTEDEYKLFLEFFYKYMDSEFHDLNHSDPRIVKLEKMMRKNKQFIYIADMMRLNILHVSSTIKDNIGIEPDEFDPGFEYATTHPEEMQRHSVVRGKLIGLCTGLYNTNDFRVMSTNMRSQHKNGHYINWLNQAYIFSSTHPKPKVYAMFIKTNIDWFGPIKHGYHYYVGKNPLMFRFPDKKLIDTGCIFTDREYEILRAIRNGMDSNKIGESLFISPHTVDTHRRNILKKTGFHSTSDLIIDLQESGFF